MGLLIFILFLTVPLIEIVGFIQIGGLIGLWPTLGVVILTAIAGSFLLRYQGMSTLFQAQSKLNQGALPLDEVIDGLCLALAGALLLTPGFFTDFFGFLLFIPWFRRGFAKGVYHKFIKPNLHVGSPFPADGAGDGRAGAPKRGQSGPVIDGEWEDVSPAEQSERKTDRSPSDQQNGGRPKGSSPWRS